MCQLCFGLECGMHIFKADVNPFSILEVRVGCPHITPIIVCSHVTMCVWSQVMQHVLTNPDMKVLYYVHH